MIEAAAIWAEVRDAPYPWEVPKAAKAALLRLAPETDLAGLDHAATNARLREIVGPILRGDDEARRKAAARWIVAEWGGIKKNRPATMAGYLAGMGGFTLADVDAFADARGTAGISSWSKIAAFAQPEAHAIYDARAAVALNAMFARAGLADLFYMPASQNKDATAAAIEIKRWRRRRGGWLGYRAYLAMLRAMADAGAGSILAAEMALFAAGPMLARTLALPPRGPEAG